MYSFGRLFFTLNCWTFTSKTQFLKFHLKVASYFNSWDKNKYVTLEMRLLWKYMYIQKSILAYQFPLYLPKYCEFESWNFGIEKTMGFYLIPKKILLLWLSPGGWCWSWLIFEHPTLRSLQHMKSLPSIIPALYLNHLHVYLKIYKTTTLMLFLPKWVQNVS